MSQDQEKNSILLFEEAVESQDTIAIQSLAKEMHPADFEEIFPGFSLENQRFIIDTLPLKSSALILSNLDEDDVKTILKEKDPLFISKLINYLDSDDAADILLSFPVKVREEVIAHIEDKEFAENIIDLLYYEDDCAGGLMAKEFITTNINWTVKECIEEIRRQAKRVEKVLTVYVVDDKGILQGRISLKKIILSKDDVKIKDICIPNIRAVQTYDSDEDVADMMQKYDLEVVPVVNVQGKLMGRITIDDIVDVITENAEVDQQLMAGISENIEASDTIWMITRARLPWLIIGMAGGLLGAKFIGLFERDLAIIPAMAFFIPLITATGGNVGIQSSTIIVQTLASSGEFLGKKRKLFAKSFSVAIINGLAIAILVFLFNIAFSSFSMAAIVSISLFCVVILASTMGTLTPLVLNRFNINPALASGPFFTTTNDLLGLSGYFLTARLLLSVGVG